MCFVAFDDARNLATKLISKVFNLLNIVLENKYIWLACFSAFTKQTIKNAGSESTLSIRPSFKNANTIYTQPISLSIVVYGFIIFFCAVSLNQKAINKCAIISPLITVSKMTFEPA